MPRPLPAGPVRVELDDVAFRYPSADEVSLASLESVATRRPPRQRRRAARHHVRRRARVSSSPWSGPSGAGKTTHHLPRGPALRPDRGRRPRSTASTCATPPSRCTPTVGVVTQDAHLFHDTIRANLAYARPDATEDEMVAALRAPRSGRSSSSLPEGLDTVVGDRGHRLSGGEKQRLAIARLLLKGPGARRPRRGHRAPRQRVRGRRPAGPRPRAGRPHGPGHRPPAVHRARRRPDPRRRRRPRRRARHATTSCSPAAASTPTCTAPSSPSRPSRHRRLA